MPSIDRLAPEFELEDLTGKPHRLSEYRGRIAIVNFWSAECPWTERVDHELTRLLPGWGEHVALLTLAGNVNEESALILEQAHHRGLVSVLLAARTGVPEAYDAKTTPHLFVVDPDGILRYQGAFDDVTFRQRTPAVGYLAQAVEALLSGGRPDPAETPPYGCALVRQLPDSC